MSRRNSERRLSQILESLESKKISAFSNLGSEDFRKGVHAVKDGFHKDFTRLFEEKQLRVVGRGWFSGDGGKQEVLIFGDHTWGFSKDYVKIDGPRSVEIINRELKKLGKEVERTVKDEQRKSRSGSTGKLKMDTKSTTVGESHITDQKTIMTTEILPAGQHPRHHHHSQAVQNHTRKLSFNSQMPCKNANTVDESEPDHGIDGRGGRSCDNRIMPGSFWMQDEERATKYANFDATVTNNYTAPTQKRVSLSESANTLSEEVSMSKDLGIGEVGKDVEFDKKEPAVNDLTATLDVPEKTLSPSIPTTKNTANDGEPRIHMAESNLEKSRKRRSWVGLIKFKSKALTSTDGSRRISDRRRSSVNPNNDDEYDLIEDFDGKSGRFVLAGNSKLSSLPQDRPKRWSSRW